MAAIPPFSGTQLVAQWQQDFTNAANAEQSLVIQAFDHGLAQNVLTILNDVRARLGEKWGWTWPSLVVALFGIEGRHYAMRF
jgi:hypothetical protein